MLLFVIIVAIFVSRAVLFAASSGSLLGKDEEDVFNYQNASYFLAFSYSYCFHYVFFIKHDEKNRYINLLMLILLFVFAAGCLVGGGRGSFVYLVAITTFFVLRILKQSGRGNMRNIMLLLTSASIILYLFSILNIFDSVGFSRVQEGLTTDGTRNALWEKAIDVFFDSPILGSGLGSVWWTVGFYSHNILSDLLAETGILGTVIFFSVLIKILRTLMNGSKTNLMDMFVLIVMFCGLIGCLFSGYWIASHKMFLAFGYDKE